MLPTLTIIVSSASDRELPPAGTQEDSHSRGKLICGLLRPCRGSVVGSENELMQEDTDTVSPDLTEITVCGGGEESKERKIQRERWQDNIRD